MALTTGQKAGWGLADMGVVTFVVIKQLLILSFLTTVMGVPVLLAGWVTTSILLFDIITDPMIGSYSDKTQSKWGRRAPWMFWGAIVMALGTIGIFAVPESVSQELVIGWVGLAFAIATIGFTMVTVPYSAMSGEITEDPKERSQMTAWRMTFASLGILIGGAVLPAIANQVGYTIAGFIIAPLLIAPIWLSILFTRNVPSSFRPTQLGVGDMAKTIFSNAPFVVLLVTYGIMTLAVATLTAGLPFAAIYLFSDDGLSPLSGIAQALSTVSFVLAAFVVGSLISQAFWAYLSNIITKVMALVIGLGLYVGLLVYFEAILPITSVSVLGAFFLMIGFANGAYQQIPWAMYPDLMDITRAETGQRIEGAFSAVWLFGQKVANALAPLLLGSILAAFGFEESRGEFIEQAPEAINALQFAMTYVPAIVFAVAILVLLVVYLPLLRRARG